MAAPAPLVRVTGLPDPVRIHAWIRTPHGWRAHIAWGQPEKRKTVHPGWIETVDGEDYSRVRRIRIRGRGRVATGWEWRRTG